MTKNAKPSVKRPALGRTRPRRGPETTLRSSSPEADRDDDRDLRAEERGTARALKSAYDVLDGEMRRGFEFARGSLGTRRRGRGGDDLYDLAGSGVRAIAQLLGLWADLVSPLLPPALRLVRGGRPRLARYERDRYEDDRYEDDRREDDRREDDGREREDGPRGFDSRERPQGDDEHHDEIHLSLDVTSAKPVTVTLELDGGLDPGALHVHALRSRENLAPITGAAVSVMGENQVRVRVQVPDDQPNGTYQSTVLSADRKVRLGRLRVAVRDAG